MIPAAPDMLVRCILSRSELAPYEVPFEFYRRGCDDCYYSHSVEAIFNFFFVLEYLFGEGKFRSAQLETEFLKSNDLKNAVGEAQQQLISPALQSTRWAASAIVKYGRSSFANIVKAVIDLRGFLHHQSLGRRKNWNPGTQAEFEADAHFLEFVCEAVLVRPALVILFAPTAMHEFVSTPVFGPNDQRIVWKPIPPPESDSGLRTN
jgi:hypothetical protein